MLAKITVVILYDSSVARILMNETTGSDIAN